MKIQKIKDVLDATVIEGEKILKDDVKFIYASDLMSDVLAFGKSDSILLTGLANHQSVISAHMAEFKGVVFIRGKKPRGGSENYARENHLILLSTDLDMYDSCVRIDSIHKSKTQKKEKPEKIEVIEDILLSQDFHIEGSDFANAGVASTNLKSILKKIGLDPKLIRRVAISTYEGEMNVVMHAKKAKVTLIVTPKVIEVVIADTGKGIPDVTLALQEGFTTSTEEMRAMGFGSGMGLPNIKKNTDQLQIQSEINIGTRLEMKFFI